MRSRTGTRHPPTPRYIYHKASPEARPAAPGCALCGTQARPLSPPYRGRSGACAATAAPWVPRGCPLVPPGPRHAAAILGRSRPFGPRPPSPRLARECQGSPRSPFAGAGHGVTPTHPFARRYATPRLVATGGVRGGGSVDLRPRAGTARISSQGYVAYLLNIRILSPVAPPDWSVFTWRIELTCGSPFGRLLPSCISVLSFIVSILVVIRSL